MITQAIPTTQEAMLRWDESTKSILTKDARAALKKYGETWGRTKNDKPCVLFGDYLVWFEFDEQNPSQVVCVCISTT